MKGLILACELDVVGADLDGGCDEARKLHQKTLRLGATERQKTPRVAVERSANHADLFAVHLAPDLLRKIVASVMRIAHRVDEALHVGVPHNGRLAGGMPQTVAVLQCADVGDCTVEGILGGPDEEEVGDYRLFLTHPYSPFDFHRPTHRREDLEAPLHKFLVGAAQGMAPFKIPHHEPFHCADVFHNVKPKLQVLPNRIAAYALGSYNISTKS